MRPTALVVALVVVALSVSCASTPEPGEHGEIRFIGRVQGTPPLRLFPPVADVQGNVYTLFGALDFPQVSVFLSRVGGGEASSECSTRGDRYGAHGWVGFRGDHAYYWSGDALVGISATTHTCFEVLEREPGTNVTLFHRAVLPWVRDAPSRPSIVAFVQSLSDPTPFSTMIDLNINLMTNIQPFSPPDAQGVKIIGTGAHREKNVGFVLLQYQRGDGALVTEGRWYDWEANETARVPIQSEALDEYAVRGWLELGDAGLVVGLLADGRLVEFDRTAGRIVGQQVMERPVGVHRWEDELYLVGLNGGRPVVAPIDARGAPGPAVRWEASEGLASNLRGPKRVLDDRTLPSRGAIWPEVATAIGEFPFLSPFSPVRHAEGTTLWLVTGPSFDGGGIRTTSVGMVPAGISYP